MSLHRVAGLPRVVRWGLGLGLLLAAAPAAFADASTAASRQSESSLAASVEVPAAALVALSEGGRFVVQSVDASAGVVVLIADGASEAASFTLRLSRDAIVGASIVAGTAVSVTAVASGWLLYVGSEAIAFVADAAVRPHLHSRRVDA